MADNNGDDIDTLGFNKDFAKRFEHNKRREELQRAKEKYGQNLSDLSDASSETSEDEDGELVNEQVTQKFLETVTMLRDNDPKAKSASQNCFDDEIFEQKLDQETKEAKPTVTYKDLVRQAIEKKGGDIFDEDKEGKKETLVSEMKRLKNAFMEAGEDVDNDNFLEIKEKTREQLDQEKMEFDDFLKNEARYERTAPSGELDILKKYWESSNNDPTDRFLRNFILSKGWIEKDGEGFGLEEEDEEDEEREEEIEGFEHAYNFRFEEPEGYKLLSHQREIEGSMRRKNNARANQRDERKKRQEEERIRHIEEIKRIKNLKKQEFLEKIKEIREVAGSKVSISDEALDDEFNPEAHDSAMQKAFGEKYYNKEEKRPEEIRKVDHEDLQLPEDVGIDLEASADEEEEEEDNEEPMEQDADKAGVADEYMKEIEQIANEYLGGDGLWWLCDECEKPIKEGKNRYDCVVCDNFTLCGTCKKEIGHNHKLRKMLVPVGCKVPQDFSLENKKEFEYTNSSKEKEKLEGVEKEIKEKYDQFLEEYYNLDYEDVIGGSLKTRFKYAKVKPMDYDLDDDELLLVDEKKLNQYIGLKKLAPYREDHGRVKKPNKSVRERIKKELKKQKLALVEGEVKGKNQKRKDMKKNKKDRKKELQKIQKEIKKKNR